MESDPASNDPMRSDPARSSGATWPPSLDALEPRRQGASSPSIRDVEAARASGVEPGGSARWFGRRVGRPRGGADARRAGLRGARAVFFLAGSLVLIEFVAALLEGFRVPAFDWLVTHFAHEPSAVWRGEVWRLLTATCLHGAFFHLALNAGGIIIFGLSIETRIGARRFLLAYLVSALGGAISFQAFSAGGTGVGASGGLTGLVSVFLILNTATIRDGRLHLGRRFWTWFVVLCVLLSVDSVLASSIFGGVEVADSAHYGGLFSGLAAGVVLLNPRTKAGVRRRWKIAGLSGALAAIVLVYGTVLPVFDWAWYLWRAEGAFRSGSEDSAWIAAQQAQALYFGGDEAALAIVDLEARRGRLAEAWRVWESPDIESDEVRRRAGYIVFDGLYAEHGYGEEVEIVLERLLELSDQALLTAPEDPLELNQSAWFRALRRKDLDVALEYARRAVAVAPAPSIVNTLGWVHFVRGEHALALEHLQEAVVRATIEEHTDEEESNTIWGIFRRAVRATWSRGGGTRVDPGIASCYLYLGIALHQTGQLEDARRVVESTRRLSPLLERHERRLLAELEAKL